MSFCQPPHASQEQRPIPVSAGIGLRPAHYDRVIEQRPAVAWFEVHAENHMTGGHLTTSLRDIALDYPLSLHAVGLSLGSTSPPEYSHLARLQDLVAELHPDLVSDHLSWSAVDGVHLPDLLPLPYTEEALRVVIRNISVVQEKLRRRLLIENPSRYLSLPDSTMSEGEFLSEIVLRTGCGVLLDVNNLYVTAVNMGASPLTMLSDFLSQISPDDIGEIHLAGHTLVSLASGGSLLVDDHGSNVCAEVWALFEATVAQLGPVPTLVEWDNNLPSFETLHAQAAGVQLALSHGLGQRHARVD
jgi:uncharacterized protein